MVATERQKRLTRLLDEIGQSDYNLASFQTRLRLQKAVYLMQSFGADLGYRYNWYIRGPYSSSLADDLYAIEPLKVSLAAEAQKSVELTSDGKALLNRVARALDARPEGLSDYRWYELLASARYLKDQGKGEHEASTILRTRKDFTSAQIELARSALSGIAN
jgi:uncharacterized protein YwgA